MIRPFDISPTFDIYRCRARDAFMPTYVSMFLRFATPPAPPMNLYACASIDIELRESHDAPYAAKKKKSYKKKDKKKRRGVRRFFASRTCMRLRRAGRVWPHCSRLRRPMRPYAHADAHYRLLFRHCYYHAAIDVCLLSLMLPPY